MKLFFIRTGPDRLNPEQRPSTRINPFAPLVTILSFIAISFALFYFEIGVLQAGKEENENIAIQTNKIRDQARETQNQTTYVRTHQEQIKKATDGLLTGMSSQPLSQDAFRHLFDLAINIQTDTAPTKTNTTAGPKQEAPNPNWTYSLSSNLVEWHRLLPAIAATESDFPLLRFTKLQFSSPQQAFYTQATSLAFSGQFITARPVTVLPPAIPRRVMPPVKR